jgi:hypothetical protein
MRRTVRRGRSRGASARGGGTGELARSTGSPSGYHGTFGGCYRKIGGCYRLPSRHHETFGRRTDSRSRYHRKIGPWDRLAESVAPDIQWAHRLRSRYHRKIGRWDRLAEPVGPGKRHAATTRAGLPWEQRTMGSLYDFTCATCGYVARVAGGEDCGGSAVGFATVLCRSCKKLVEVVVKERVWDPASAREPRCPRSRRHAVALWTDPGACPKCGAILDRPEMPSLLWD